MRAGRIREWLSEKIFGQTLRRRLSSSVLLVSCATICALAVLAGLTHHHMVMVKVRSEAKTLATEFWAKSIVAPIKRPPRPGSDTVGEDEKEPSERNVKAALRVQGQPFNALLVLPREFASEPLTRRGEAYVTLEGNLLWSSGAQPFESLVADGGPGLRTVSDRRGMEKEVFLHSNTEGKTVPVKAAEDEGEPTDHHVDVTFYVTLNMESYRREMWKFRFLLGGVVAAVMAVLGLAVHLMIRQQVAPLERITQAIRGLKGGSGERLKPGDSDPLEVFSLTEQFNAFLRKQEEVKELETRAKEAERNAELEAEKATVAAYKEKMADLRAEEAKRNTELEAEKAMVASYKENMAGLRKEMRTLGAKTLNTAGFMHAVARLLYPARYNPGDRTIREEVERAHEMIEGKLNELIAKGNKRSVDPTDVVSVTMNLLAARTGEADERSVMQKMLENTYWERRFPRELFSGRYEEGPLYVESDKVEFEEMMVSLLHNAGREARSKVRVSVGCEDGMVQIAIEDDGRGFAEAGRRKLLAFGKETRSSGEKHGVGLPHVRHVACQLYGDLLLEDSRELGGARVVLELPLVEMIARDGGASGEEAHAQRPVEG